ncbi:Hypothetical predicted protein [Cloeon dipterum]|uniref:Uncharacterized protein n=1 Tax=Cloeon dipterum TaxID=197152 RepID=A0A8S1DJU4_9INSE|nr:Hypothetical predicted protein [Cloeon dipterum]
MATISPIDMQDLCRICGERLDESNKSVDIFESGPTDGVTYAKLIGSTQSHDEPNEGDGLPRRIGIECANFLVRLTSNQTAVNEMGTKLPSIQIS